MEVQNVESIMSRQRKLRLLGGLFLGLLIVCTLFSNTLLSLTLPKVLVEVANTGKMVLTYQGTATIEPVEERNLSGPTDWKITKVFVQEGDAVQKGQVLAEYDNSEAIQQIEEEKASLRKLELTLDKLKYDYIQAADSEDPALILSAKVSLESTMIDIDLQKQRIARMQEKMSSNQKLAAPFDGIITAVYAKEGLTGTPGLPDMRLSNLQQGFQFQLQIPTDLADLLSVGEAIDGRLIGQNRFVQGSVSNIKEAPPSLNSNSPDGKLEGTAATLIVKVQDTQLIGLEKVEVHLVKERNEEMLLIPKTAIRNDSSGTYVLVVETRKGPLGNSFYTLRRNVVISQTNEYTAAIRQGLFASEQVIVESSEPIREGSQVRLH